MEGVRERGGEPGIPAESARGVEGNKFFFEPALRVKGAARAQPLKPMATLWRGKENIWSIGTHAATGMRCMRDTLAQEIPPARGGAY